MCGICGFTGTEYEQEPVLSAMMTRIIHRGPDGGGQFINDDIAMGFRRLAIIDLDTGGQPMFNEDRSLVVTFNGEIYNYRELREELARLGHTFSNRADTEVLLHGYEEWGVRLLDRLRGMFAFVIWDIRRRELFAARDMFGIKPLYYVQTGGQLVYGSEIKSILEYPGYQREVNTEALEQYLSFEYSVLPETFFRGIFRLLPGHYMQWKNGEMTITRYFDPMLTPPADEKPLRRTDRRQGGNTRPGTDQRQAGNARRWTDRRQAGNARRRTDRRQDGNARPGTDPAEAAHRELVDRIDAALQESIRYHMVSDVEVASLLSSGVDSGYVACHFHGARTYTVGFDYETYNEIPYAEELSRSLGIENHSKVISTEEYWAELPRIQYFMDEPLADASAAALYFVDREAAKDVKVILSGEGSDELFGGYVIYHEPMSLARYQRLPARLRKGLAALARRVPGHPKGKGFLLRGADSVEERFIGNANVFTVAQRRKILLHPTDVTPADLTRPYYAKVSSLKDTEKMQYIDLNFWLAGDILLKADKMSMAHSLESRVPFLDRGVWECAKNIPLSEKVTDENTKVCFREAARRYLSDRQAEKKKLGFPVPIRIWLRTEKYYEIVKKEFCSKAAGQFFHRKELVRLLDEHKAGHEDYARHIWIVYMFLLWYREYFTEDGCSVSMEDELAIEENRRHRVYR